MNWSPCFLEHLVERRGVVSSTIGTVLAAHHLYPDTPGVFLAASLFHDFFGVPKVDIGSWCTLPHFREEAVRSPESMTCPSTKHLCRAFHRKWPLRRKGLFRAAWMISTDLPVLSPQSAAAAPSPVLGNIPPNDGMPGGPIPPGFFQVRAGLGPCAGRVGGEEDRKAARFAMV